MPLVNLRDNQVYAPPVVPFPAARPAPPPRVIRNELNEVVRPRECHAFLESHNTQPERVNTFNRVIHNYVIIGRGFAATVDLATLQSTWGRSRVGDLSIVFIGYPDPWLDYVSHNMNQEPELLILPGYKTYPVYAGDQPNERWLNSRAFANCNTAEMLRLQAEVYESDLKGFRDYHWSSVRIVQAGVKKIDRITDYYRIYLDGEEEPLRAEKIDICSGTGQQLISDTTTVDRGYGVDMTNALWLEYQSPGPVDGGAWTPKVSAAEMFVRGNCKVKRGGSICITGASPAGLQAMEHALCEDGAKIADDAAAEVFMVASGPMNPGFPAIGRLDYHAKDQNGAPLPKRQDFAAGDLSPTNAKVLFGEGYKVQSIEPVDVVRHALMFEGIDHTAAGKLLVVFKVSGTRQRLAAHNGSGPGPKVLYGVFDQVVLGTGRLRGGRGSQAANEIGSAVSLVWDFRTELQAITVAGYPFPLGLQTADGAIRLLGAAGLNNPILRATMAEDRIGMTPLQRYERSLPAQSRVNGEGVTLAAVTIGLANRFFRDVDDERNDNVNTATLGELTTLIGGALGRDTYYTRHERVAPFSRSRQVSHAVEFYRFREDRVRELEAIDEELREVAKTIATKEARAQPLTPLEQIQKERLEINRTRKNLVTYDMNDDRWLLRETDDWLSFNARWLDGSLGPRWARTFVGDEHRTLSGLRPRYAHYFDRDGPKKEIA